ncbi:MAG: calcium/proton exchanger [Planctomycetes bacterium]|nr:calcium/proton exchanger [Planctomycetota bacterium]
MSSYLKPSLNWLLVFIPIAAYQEFIGHNHTWIFIASCLAIIPAAGWMGRATEHLAERTGDGIGGLLNATFGNAAELIIALIALHAGMYDVVKASITGSIIGNLLLVLGAACFAGGLKHPNLPFNAKGVSSYSSMVFLAAASLVAPATFHHLGGESIHDKELSLSLVIAIVLIITYGCSLLFSLHTHRQLFTGSSAQAAEVEDEAAGTHWSVKKAISVLVGATVVLSILAEWMVGSVTHAATAFGMTNVFVGVIIVAIVGNAAEHSTAILMAMKKRMDLAVGIALGSSIQIALFVAPVLVFASYFIGPESAGPMDLVFTTAEVLAIILAVLVTEQVVGDGESNWLEGVQLLSVYIIIGVLFYFLPEALSSGAIAPAAPGVPGH